MRDDLAITYGATDDPIAALTRLAAMITTGDVSVDEAWGAIRADGRKPWQTPWWKSKRREKIGARCQVCHADTGPMILQHIWHPRGFGWHQATLRSQRWESWKLSHQPPAALADFAPTEEAQGCPVCRSPRIRYRKATNDWVCDAGTYGGLNQRHGQSHFANPITIAVVPRERQAALRAWNRANWEAFRKSMDDADLGISLVATLRCIADSIRYLSMTDTITACKRCAFLQDLNHIAARV